MVIAMFVGALDEIKLLGGYGLITRDGELKEWPRMPLREGRKMREFRNIDGLTGPNDHYLLRQFFSDPDQAQEWLDLLNFSTPAKELWLMAVREHGAKR